MARRTKPATRARSAAAPIVLRAHRPGDMGWVIGRHGALYAAEYGWDITFEAFVAEIAARFLRDFDPERERSWIAERDGEIVGCCFLVRRSKHIAKLRMLLVDPAARGQQLGARLVAACIAEARALGYRRLVLWTNDILVAARRIYEKEGFRLVRRERHVSFGKRLVGEYWEFDLAKPAR
jgi:N-acetylglutamate synthase-like GNAT family acetyltransferase